MKKTLKYSIVGIVIILFWGFLFVTNASILSFKQTVFFPEDSLNLTNTEKSDSTILLRFPFKDRTFYPFYSLQYKSPLYLNNPSNINSTVVYDPISNNYIFSEKIGNFNYRPSNFMPLDEYRAFDFKNSMQNYWRQRSKGEGFETQSSFIPRLHFGGEAFDKVFGSNTIDIRPQGSAVLIFGINTSRIDNPTLTEKLRKSTTFDFQEKIQMNVTGSIGDKMKLGVNYNTEATFDFENKTKLEYSGKEDEIIKKIEAGNITLPLSGSLITGSQSLFGLKTELQFGKLTVTSVFSQQKGETSVIEVEGGAQTSSFEVLADEYDANKHFFLSHYFRDNYNNALKNLPIINSGINITKIEVWVTNKTGNFENSRNIIGFMDLAEADGNIFASDLISQVKSGIYPENDLNNLYELMTTIYSDIRRIDQITSTLMPLTPDFVAGQDFEKIENARKLSPSEYKINSKLGYISLNAALNAAEVLAVAFEYTITGKTYRVGELSSDGVSAPNVIIVKLLKGTNLTPKLPTWDLMMKNVYAIGAYQVNSREFQLDVLYQNDETGTAINYLPEGKISNQILLTVLNLDNLNSQLDPYPDGVFDFIEGITINSSNGRVFFPVLEPFGEYLRKKIDDDAIAEKYVFQELYDSTQTKARQIAEKNKFKLTGAYQSSSSSEITLNAMNVPQGSVIVTAGGIKLTENIDYTVDYTLGRVKIINQGLLESGTPIKISLESHSLFNIQTKSLIGSHFDYNVSDDINIGGTILNLTERPLTQKVNIGDEAISNTIWGLNGSYRTESQFITSLIDKLPFLETKEPSTITVNGEFAQIIPGHTKIKGVEKSGVAYIDDFEGSKTSIDMKSFGAWVIASTPQGQVNLFPEASLNNDRAYGYNRAKLAWYVIDPLFLRNTSTTPGHIKANPNLQSSHFVREIFEKEIFPYKESPSGIPTNIAVLNLAYYPEEKGPYNYDVRESNYSAGIDETGKLKDPASRWGGIMREVQANDFETANIEFIEFWLMDPFVYDSTNKGGNLFFNLGNISEDVLKDSKKGFENGLPSTEDVVLVDTTTWGRVPLIQSLVNAFNNDINSRKYQDVGLDGLSNSDENSFFNDYLDSIAAEYGTESEAYQNSIEDPSSDNFHYFRGSDYDVLELDILERYKQYNGLEGNSPTSEQSPEAYPTSGTTLPNVEDINRDNTLSEAESYFQYSVKLAPEDLQVGQNYITDVITSSVKLATGEKSSINWYQFKIPLSDYDDVIGSIQDFKSIRFLRMFLTGFEEEVILRFVTLDLVRSEWRKYNLSFREGGESLSSPEPSEGTFEISAVNIEENGKRIPINYVLPPGINRIIDPTNPQLRQLNEQSIVLKVNDLEDGDARAAFKNVNLDIRQYNKLQMEVHAETLNEGALKDGDLTVFIRLGSDYKDNFYEYEIPLMLTPHGTYNNNIENDRLIVWPQENRFDIDLEVFQKAKQIRNDELRRSGTNISLTSIFTIFDGENRVKISGNPNLSNIRTIMIGIRNPSQLNNWFDNDDGLTKSGEVWLNELRLTDFNEKGGWAANARITAKLANFGNLTFAGSTSQPGFGSIEKKVNERSKEEVIQYDISSNFELGKFFPEKTGVKIPMYLGYSESMINPQYNPLDPDILLKVALKNAENKNEMDSIAKISQDYTRRRSINFTNVTIAKSGGKPRFYDISNWNYSYFFNEVFSRNINTEYNILKNYRGAITYNYSSRPKNVTPFKNFKKLFKAPIFRIIKDFNFFYMPSNLSFRTDLNRQYNEIQLRNISNPDIFIKPTFKKEFTWNRFYDFKYDLSKALKIDFSATNMARIDEPEGRINKNDDDYEAKKDSILQNLYDFGRTTRYHHTIYATYTVPINKIPLFNWTSLTARYNASYGWDVGPITPDTIDLGNSIKNSRNIQLSSQLNFINLYNKVGVLKKINQKYGRGSRGRTTQKQYKTVTFERDNVVLKSNVPKSIFHKLNTDNVEVKAFDSEGNPIKGKVKIVNKSKITFTADKDYSNIKIQVEGKIEQKENLLILIAEHSTKFLMAVKNVSFSFSQKEGTSLPGYKPETKILGMEKYNNIIAPGGLFILGFQNKNFANMAVENNWLSKDSLLNSPYLMSFNNSFNLRSTLEPINNMRIDVNANRSYSRNISEYYIADQYGEFPANMRSRMETGNFSMTYLTFGTAFDKISSKNNFASETFRKLSDYRIIIAKRLVSRHNKLRNELSPPYDPVNNPDPNETDPETEFPYGYGPTSQEVIIPAFLAAYGNKDPNKIPLEPFPSILCIMPNWRVTYDGLIQIGFIKKYLRTINISHAYRSSYNVGSFTTNLFYQKEKDGLSYIRDIQNNFIPEHEIHSVSISEQFNPLIDFDMTWKNSLTSGVEIKKSRTLSLSLANNQLTEIFSSELVIGTGYRFDDVEIIIRTGGGQKSFKSDLNIRADISIRDNRTIIRKLTEAVPSIPDDQITAGQRIITIKTTIDYVLSDRFNLRFFYDRIVNKPFVSLSYPTSNTNIGFSVRFTLA